MQARVGVGHGHEVALLAPAQHLGEDFPQLGDRFLIGFHRGVARRQALQRRADFQDLHSFLLGHAPDRCAAVALAGDQSIVLKADERRSHRGAANAQSSAELLLEQTLAGQQLAAHDRPAQILVTVGADHLVYLVLSRFRPRANRPIPGISGELSPVTLAKRACGRPTQTSQTRVNRFMSLRRAENMTPL